MRLDTKTVHTLRKFLPTLVEEEYSRTDVVHWLEEILPCCDDDGAKRFIPKQLQSNPAEHYGLIPLALLEYAESDTVYRYNEDAYELTNLGGLIPIAWGVFSVGKQRRILHRLNRPFNKPEGVYARARDSVIRRDTESNLIERTGNFEAFRAIAQAFRGVAPWSLTLQELL